MTCPRCHDTVDQALYGPCDRCRTELRAMRAPAPDSRYGPAHPVEHARPIPTGAA